jgi:hypothetical protein
MEVISLFKIFFGYQFHIQNKKIIIFTLRVVGGYSRFCPNMLSIFNDQTL